MKIIKQPLHLTEELQTRRQKNKISVGFVPTMGALHDGHLELIRQSKRRHTVTVVSLFVNPTQFGPREDFNHYPRPLQRDQVLLRKAGVDYLLLPSKQAMYPGGREAIYVDLGAPDSVRPVTEMYCGRSRPGHFRGVLTVCAKLFSIVRPDSVYMGMKDYQQTVVIDRLIRELHLNIQLVRVATVRERDGLALSSRNAYLTAAERARAAMISKVLFEAKKALKQDGKKFKTVLRQARTRLSAFVDKVDYFEAADPVTLLPLGARQKKMVLLTACYVGKTRLIDNVIINLRG